MAEAPQLPPPNMMIREINTPNQSAGFFRELVDRTTARWLENNPIKRGTLYSALKGADDDVSRTFPELFFLKETVPIGSNTVAGMTQHRFVTWAWSTDANAESSFNAEISYLGDATANSVFARKYTIRRDEYDASPFVATATPLTALLGAKVLNRGVGYTTATCTLTGPGTGGRITPVIADGRIISYVVEEEGEGYDSTSGIQIIGDGTDADAQLLVQPPSAILTSQKKVELPDGDFYSHEFVQVLRVWEILPGPWLPETRYDDDLGPIQMRRRAVLNTGQLGGVITPVGKRNYASRDGSSVVSIELEENWSDGTGTPGNPPYPILVWDLYVDERGSIQRTSQIVRATGSEVASFTRTGTDPNVTVTKIWFAPYADNPYLLKKFVETWIEPVHHDRKLSSEFGGGELAITERTSEPGSAVLDLQPGLLTVSDETQTLSPHEQKRRTLKLSGGPDWPILHGFHTDEVTGIVVNFTKQVVPEGTPYPGRSGYRGPFVEMQTYDKWRSIQIVSAVDLSTLPGPEAWNTTHPFTLPPTLLSVEAVWTDVKSKLAAALADSADAQVHTGSGGDAIIRSRAGFRGSARAIQARYYIYGSPLLANVPQPLKILPSSGSIIFTATDSNTQYKKQDDGGTTIADGFRISVHATDIRDHLVGPDMQVLNATHTSPPQSATATSGGGSIAAVAAAGTQSRMDVSIPFSTPVPSQLSPGTQILYDVEVREWRFGIWVVDQIYITIP